MGQVPWMALMPLEPDSLPDQDRLFGCRQVGGLVEKALNAVPPAVIHI